MTTLLGNLDPAAVQAWSAIAIVALTAALVFANFRVIGEMKRERNERGVAGSKQAAAQLVDTIIDALDEIELRPGAAGLEHAFKKLHRAEQRWAQLLIPGLRTCMVDLSVLLISARFTIEVPSVTEPAAELILRRSRMGLANVRTALNAHRAGEKLPANELPSAERAQDWLLAPDGARVYDFQDTDRA